MPFPVTPEGEKYDPTRQVREGGQFTSRSAEKVPGYRVLDERALEAIKSLKQMEEYLLRDLEKAPAHLIDGRWMAIAKTHLQQGFMCAIRSIAQPQRLNDEELK